MFYPHTYDNVDPEESSWQNVPLVEKKSKPQRKLGRWPENQTRKEKGHNLP